MATDRIPASVRDELHARAEKVRDYFNLANSDFVSAAVDRFELTAEGAQHLAQFNVEWHIIPPARVVPFDDEYLARLYPSRCKDFDRPLYEVPSLRQSLRDAHMHVEGKIIGVEVTQKPSYLPANVQFYGSQYGLDASLDPFTPYIEKAGLRSGPRFIASRFAQTASSLRALGEVVRSDWQSRRLIPVAYTLAACPPTVFNLIGTLFHQRWSETNSVELSSYRDDHGNAIGFGVGSNAPGDFSYIRRIGTEADLNLLGFRVALVPES